MADAPFASDAAALDAAVEAYVYLYPLVTMELTRRQLTDEAAAQALGVAPVNSFAHVRSYPDAGFRTVVRPNFDTLYSSAILDLSNGPVVIDAPAVADRYFALPMLDMWTDCLAVPGSRTCGEGPFRVVVASPGAELPDDALAVTTEGRFVWVVGRTQCNGPADYPAVRAIQDQLRITAPEVAASGERGDVDPATSTLEQVNGMDPARYLELAHAVARENPPRGVDWSTLRRMARFGFDLERPFDPDSLQPAVRARLDEVRERALERIRRATSRIAATTDGWQVPLEMGGAFGTSYARRAAVTMVGLAALPPEEAVYPLAVADDDGDRIDGATDYTLRFEADRLPPVDAFWSVTLYDGDGFPVANPADRFAIGDRDDLRFNADGSLEIVISREAPDGEPASNWLPSTAGPLGITMRLYLPRMAVLDGRWTPPPLRKRR